jgi:hypothetical protein
MLMGVAMHFVRYAIGRITIAFQVVDLIFVTVFAQLNFLSVFIVMAIVAFFAGA